MRFLLFLITLTTALAFAESPAKADSIGTASENPAPDDGIPWNNDRFDPSRLVRHDTFDPALKVAYSYSLSFLSYGPIITLSRTVVTLHVPVVSLSHRK